MEQMAQDLGCTVSELIADKQLRLRIQPERYLTDTVGMPTLKDILQELDKPGRDPRGPIKVFEFDPNVRTLDDLREGMELPGIVGNITNFGAFVDIGIKENGLIHLSQLADRYISDPNEVVSIHQHVRVRVLGIDTERKRIQLTLRGVSQEGLPSCRAVHNNRRWPVYRQQAERCRAASLRNRNCLLSAGHCPSNGGSAKFHRCPFR